MTTQREFMIQHWIKHFLTHGFPRDEAQQLATQQFWQWQTSVAQSLPPEVEDNDS